MSNDSSPAIPEFRDQRIGLIIFGALQLAIGCFCVLGALFTSLLLLVNPSNMPPEAQVDAKMMLPGIMFYVLVAILFTTLGFGSILAKRWAWSLTVVISWLWMIIGLFAVIVLVLVMPSVMSAMPQQGRANLPPGSLSAVMAISMILVGIFYVVLPGSFLVFYQRSATWETCRRRDPKARWTERCPLPLLALAIMLGYSALWLPFQLLYGGGVAPFFGKLVSGAAGVVLILASAVIMAFLAWGIYGRKMAAWWGTLVFWTFWGVSASITFSKVGLLELYEMMEIPPNQLELLKKSGMLDGNYLIASMIGGFVCALVFLLWVRRYFVTVHGPVTSSFFGPIDHQ
ncbi:MAG: hypothetical protein GX594_06560 [Pirellulaceae bacterium]|nr:hypothetical protein [Pirellulaceae bacterium]